MRHQKATFKLGRKASHRRALMSNLATSLFTHERIETTVAKARLLRPFAERLITLGKRGDLHSRRLAARYIHKPSVLVKLFSDVAERCRDRPGGYTRILKTRFRRGDNSPLAFIELVDSAPTSGAKDKSSNQEQDE